MLDIITDYYTRDYTYYNNTYVGTVPMLLINFVTSNPFINVDVNTYVRSYEEITF